MPAEMTKEKFTAILTQAAVQRFGQERAEALIPAIQETAAFLSSLARYEIEREEEPAFFL